MYCNIIVHVDVLSLFIWLLLFRGLYKFSLWLRTPWKLQSSLGDFINCHHFLFFFLLRFFVLILNFGIDLKNWSITIIFNRIHSFVFNFSQKLFFSWFNNFCFNHWLFWLLNLCYNWNWNRNCVVNNRHWSRGNNCYFMWWHRSNCSYLGMRYCNNFYRSRSWVLNFMSNFNFMLCFRFFVMDDHFFYTRTLYCLRLISTWTFRL